MRLSSHLQAYFPEQRTWDKPGEFEVAILLIISEHLVVCPKQRLCFTAATICVRRRVGLLPNRISVPVHISIDSPRANCENN